LKGRGGRRGDFQRRHAQVVKVGDQGQIGLHDELEGRAVGEDVALAVGPALEAEAGGRLGGDGKADADLKGGAVVFWTKGSAAVGLDGQGRGLNVDALHHVRG